MVGGTFAFLLLVALLIPNEQAANPGIGVQPAAVQDQDTRGSRSNPSDDLQTAQSETAASTDADAPPDSRGGEASQSDAQGEGARSDATVSSIMGADVSEATTKIRFAPPADDGRTQSASTQTTKGCK